jgi:serralysin
MRARSVHGALRWAKNRSRGGAGSNVFELTGGDQHVDGQGGLDTVVYHGARAGFSVDRQGDGFGVDDKAGAKGHDTLLNIERIRFGDGAVALDLDGARPGLPAVPGVDLLYQNVLHRPPEAAGYAYWMESLGTHHLAREAMLGIFSESVENQAQVIGSIEHGIDFVPWN